MAQFSYNLQQSEAINQSPFKIVTGQQPLTPSNIAAGYTGPTPATYKFAKSWQEKANLARACLHKTTKRTKKWANRNRRDVQYQVGDLALVKLHLVLRTPGRHKGLVRKYEGSYQIINRVGKVAYKLELPPRLKKVHLVFHVSMLKPFHQDTEDPVLSISQRAPPGANVSYEREVDSILADRVVRRQNYMPRQEYLVQWKGLPESETSWEPVEALWQFQEKIEQYHA